MVWAGANSNTDETFRVAPFGRFPGMRLVVSRSLRSRERGYGHPEAEGYQATRSGLGKKWAGANSNRGYGHPKAEGYQATPPARAIALELRPRCILTVAKRGPLIDRR